MTASIEPYVSLAEQRGLPVRTVLAAAVAGRLKDVVRLPPVRARQLPMALRDLRQQSELALLLSSPLDQEAELRKLDEKLADPVVQLRMLEHRFFRMLAS